MKNLTFSGIDANKETSLLEYGLLVSNESHADGSGTHFCVYRLGNMFGTGHTSETDLNSILLGKEWASEKDLNSFFSFVECNDRAEYVAQSSLICKLFDLISYFGAENIMGTDYSPMSEAEAIKMYL